MILLMFASGLFLYVVSALLSYSFIKVSSIPSLLLIGASIGACTHLLWLGVARVAKGPSEVFTAALMWDAMIALTYAATPVVLGASITFLQLFGAALVFVGVALAR